MLSRSGNKGGEKWLPDPALVFMNVDEVRTLGGRPHNPIGQNIWARKAELGTDRYSARSIPRSDHQILISASFDLAIAKGSAATRDEILDLVVARLKAGRLPSTAEKTSKLLRENPFEFFAQYFDPATEDSNYQGGELKYHVHATPDRAQAFFRQYGSEADRSSRGQEAFQLAETVAETDPEQALQRYEWIVENSPKDSRVFDAAQSRLASAQR